MESKKESVKNESNNKINETNKKLLIIAVPVVVILLVVGFVSIDSVTNLMGNSVSNDKYTCEDSSYELKGDKCTKQVQEQAYLIGDVNKDNSIDVLDTVLLQKNFAGKVQLDDYQKILGDVNKDGVVDTIDLAYIRKYIGNGSSGTLGATNYINQYACREGLELKDGTCYGTITVDAIYKDSNSVSSEASIGSEETVALYIGDVNKDGSIDVMDVSLLEKSNSGKVELDDYQKILGDVNKDGAVDTIDISVLKKYINSPQSGTITASSYIYHKACPSDKKLVGSNCVNN